LSYLIEGEKTKFMCNYLTGRSFFCWRRAVAGSGERTAYKKFQRNAIGKGGERAAPPLRGGRKGAARNVGVAYWRKGKRVGGGKIEDRVHPGWWRETGVVLRKL